MGVDVLDVLVRRVEAIRRARAASCGGDRITAAGSAGGTALVLAKLGASVKSAGAIGRDAAGDMLLALLECDGVDTELLVRATTCRPPRACCHPPERRAARLPRGGRERQLRPR